MAGIFADHFRHKKVEQKNGIRRCRTSHFFEDHFVNIESKKTKAMLGLSQRKPRGGAESKSECKLDDSSVDKHDTAKTPEKTHTAGQTKHTETCASSRVDARKRTSSQESDIKEVRPAVDKAGLNVNKTLSSNEDRTSRGSTQFDPKVKIRHGASKLGILSALRLKMKTKSKDSATGSLSTAIRSDPEKGTKEVVTRNNSNQAYRPSLPKESFQRFMKRKREENLTKFGRVAIVAQFQGESQASTGKAVDKSCKAVMKMVTGSLDQDRVLSIPEFDELYAMVFGTDNLPENAKFAQTNSGMHHSMPKEECRGAFLVDEKQEEKRDIDKQLDIMLNKDAHREEKYEANFSDEFEVVDSQPCACDPSDPPLVATLSCEHQVCERCRQRLRSENPLILACEVCQAFMEGWIVEGSVKANKVWAYVVEKHSFTTNYRDEFVELVTKENMHQFTKQFHSSLG